MIKILPFRLNTAFMQQHLKEPEWYERIDIHWLRLYTDSDSDSDYNKITRMNFIRKNYTLPDWFEINDIDWVRF